MKRRWLTAGALAFVLVNAVAFFHAWRFTHFSDEAGAKQASPEQLSALQKATLLLTGVQNPKPVNQATPAFLYQTVLLDSPNGRLEAWFSPVPNALGQVALFHGYTGDKSKLLTEAEFFRSQGFSVLLLDFAGNGGSEGVQTTVGYREADDVAAAFAFLKEQLPSTPLFLYGVSMGAVAILRAESELGVRPTAAILECPYGSMLQTAKNRFHALQVPAFPLANLLVFWGGVQNGFWAFDLDARAYASRIQTPTLLLYGLTDPRVTRQETDAIYAALSGPKQRRYFAGVGHEPYHSKHQVAWRSTIQRFLQRNML
ncbi:Dipeptidyl aminopeptidase/acylaminoacyl-peptidase-like [Hymenobacter roseosalivarius DSM 11622]|uniref:Dipeptidyl aminopeptidase/acylaminoacyl-peptidase-like n=1 Tax=Hymenobacter roseosalivarius DSM 11622 TaxID=645990 RepID=A0A1W1VC51_9BACT|nr:alpha/beta fold hydrolase [Hymenobacter roseosalivarius]SMB91037.1 Dipeptidyl aminopeptidase/acylaminoacyl-peptidase-like [Hymenobacter roseosalivarius DSM 11622]